MEAIIFDTETTGLADPEVIEAAWMDLQFASDAAGRVHLRLGEPVVRRFRPRGRISMGAMATHHIMDEDLRDAPPSDSLALPPGVRYLVGHNIDYDWKAIGCPGGVRRIDTLALARSAWPQCDSHSLGALTYFLFRSTARGDLQGAHSAEVDITLTANLLQAYLAQSPAEIINLEGLWQASERARVPTVMPFGKHRGLPIAEVPPDYKAWLRRQDDLDPYLRLALGN